MRYWLWMQVSRLNSRHMQLAWITLVSLVVTDAYIALRGRRRDHGPEFF